jgi:hypothetical protein
MEGAEVDSLSQLDLAFCIDLTTSMQPFLSAAQSQMVAILQSLASLQGADLQVGYCGYRDYSEHAPITELCPLSGDLEEVQQKLGALVAQSAPDNSDAAEAVLSGLEGCNSLAWRPGAYRIVILVGDAPPHGCGVLDPPGPHPDRWPERDPSGWTLSQLGATLEGKGITIFSLTMLPSSIPHYDPVTRQSFQELAQLTGGTYHDAQSAEGAMQLVQEVSRRVFGHLQLDRAVYQHFFSLSKPAGFDYAAAADPFGAAACFAAPEPVFLDPFGSEIEQLSKQELQASFDRLQKRQLIPPPGGGDEG